MKAQRLTSIALIVLTLQWCGTAAGQDWPQWRGPNRDGHANEFTSPEDWPDSLVKVWSVDVGDGVSTPAVADGKVFALFLQGDQEVMRCLSAETGEEIWKDEYAARGASGPARSFAGTRSSPAVSEGKVVTLGVDGTVTCWEADSGKRLWQNNDYRGQVPRFSTSSSPLIEEEMCIVQFGSESEGGIVAYDLASGAEKWKWTGSGTSYASPVLLTVEGTKYVLAPTGSELVAVSLTEGVAAWKMEYTQGRYNATTPVVDGQTVYVAGPNRGITAFQFSREGDGLAASEKWRNDEVETTLMYNTPVLQDGKLYGLSNRNDLFCVNAENGSQAWTNPLSGAAEPESRPPSAPPEGRGGRRRGGRGGGGRGGYGSIVTAGTALMGLSPASELVVFQADGSAFSEIARYKVSESPTYAYPVPVGDRILVKDQQAITMWSLK